MIIAADTEVQDNFEHYLDAVQLGEEIMVTQNGKEVARIVPFQSSVSFLTDSITGVLENDYDAKNILKDRYSVKV